MVADEGAFEAGFAAGDRVSIASGALGGKKTSKSNQPIKSVFGKMVRTLAGLGVRRLPENSPKSQSEAWLFRGRAMAPDHIQCNQTFFSGFNINQQEKGTGTGHGA